ncbi:MAG: cyclic lactone autoinducer peptide [Romboutsia sp.]
MKKIALKLLKNMSALSFGIAVLSANSASSWISHQASEPQALQKLKK